MEVMLTCAANLARRRRLAMFDSICSSFLEIVANFGLLDLSSAIRLCHGFGDKAFDNHANARYQCTPTSLTLHEVQTLRAMRQWRRVQNSLGHLYASVVPAASRVVKLRLRAYGGIVDSLERIPRGTYPLDAYHQLVKAGAIKLDAGQVAALQPLERLHRELETYEQPTPGIGNKLFSAVGLSRPKMAPQGVYIYGGVGTGKSLVADIFFHCRPIQGKRRVHFHQFMLDIHKRLHNMRTSHPKDADVIEVLATDVLKTGWLLCFDEFQVTDIADAMLLKRLLENLFKGGGIMVASSNRAPTELYKNGIQRELFLPCIELIKSRCQVYAFRPQASDYRLIGARPQGSSALDKVWHTPLDENSAKKMELGFKQLAGNRAIGRTILKEGSRTIEVPKAAGGVAVFTFQELCGTAKGAADYLAIASSFHTIFISDIPRLTRIHSELARRFITLVDVFYEQKVKVIVSADTDPGGLYQPRAEDAGAKGKADAGVPSTEPKYVESDEEFAFARTVSRLNHMQTSDYLSSAWADPGKAFICHLESSTLQEGDLRRVWDRYNIDSDHKLSKDELLLMMEDLTEIKSGHRYVPSELVDDMYKKLDANSDGIVVWTEFRDYFLRYGLQVQAV